MLARAPFPLISMDFIDWITAIGAVCVVVLAFKHPLRLKNGQTRKDKTRDGRDGP